MDNTTLSTQPYKGSRDFFPEDMRIRNYIFDTWKKVCKLYGYEEYDGPFLESFDIYAAKTGEEIVNEQLYSFTDRGGRKVAIRPEMTPTLARMVSQKYKTLTKPIRWFSLPNLWRYEKPQRGRLREHYQLNVDIFGVEGVEADFEILSILDAILKHFGANEKMYEIRIGNRRFIRDVLKTIGISSDQADRVFKAIDKKNKLPYSEFENLLFDDAKLNKEQYEKLNAFLKKPELLLQNLSGKSQGADEVHKLLKLVSNSPLGNVVTYDPTIMRGFDYYTGNVFELFDLNPKNNRAMCGGGRYDDLIEMFVGEKLTGIGFGMGDVTLANFLTDWKLIPEMGSVTKIFVSVWPQEVNEMSQKLENNSYFIKSSQITEELRKNNLNALLWLEKDTKLDKQLKYAERKNVDFTVIIGPTELESNTVVLKNMKSKEQEIITLDDLIKKMV